MEAKSASSVWPVSIYHEKKQKTVYNKVGAYSITDNGIQETTYTFIYDGTLWVTDATIHP